jgi:hypothetical protein
MEGMTVANCYNMKEDDVLVCDACGLEVKVTKGCSCSHDEEDACSAPMECCGQPMRFK